MKGSWGAMRTVLAVVSRSLKKVLLSRVEFWLVAVLLALATLGFGAFMKDGEGRAAPRGGALGRAAFRIGSTPENLYRRFFGDQAPPRVPGLAREQRFHRRGGLTFAKSPPPFLPPRRDTQDREAGEAGYLVVARYAPSSESSEDPVVVEMFDLNRRKIVHSWKPVSAGVLQRFNILPDGSLLVGGQRQVLRMDACSNVVWEQPLRAHHSFERDVDGNFWSPRPVEQNTIPRTNPDFYEDGVIRFSPAGEVLSQITLSSAVMRAGHSHLFYGDMGRFFGRQFRMNDVEPVLQDGPFWRRGDLFVSLRFASVVFLYRPATDEVLWFQAGPWLSQHDVDVVSDSEISVYSNNTFIDEDGDRQVLGANEVYVHDFATGETRSPWREAMRRHNVRTVFQGGATLFGDGSVMLEESDYGRVLMLSPDGEEVWSYVNRASNGMVYEIEASRWLDAWYGAEMARSIASVDCEAEME